MTFNIETPTDQAGEAGQPNQQPNTTDNVSNGADQGITLDKLNEILKRDEHAQKHIQTLEEENEQMRLNYSSLQEKIELMEAQIKSQKTVEELLTRKNTSTVDHQQGTEVTQTMNTPTNSVSTDDLDSLVNQRIQGYMQEQQQVKNLESAKKDLNEIFKDRADDHVKQVAAQNGITLEGALELAKSNPTMFNNLFVNPYKKGTTAAAPTFGSQSTSSVPTANTNEITMEYWNKMRRENSRKFFSADTQRQFHQWFHSQKQ